MERTRGHPRALAVLAVGILAACAIMLAVPASPGGRTTGFQGTDTMTSASSITITSFSDMTGNPAYVGGQTFQVQVSVRNSGTSNLKGWCIYLTFGGYAHLSAPSQNFPGTYVPGTTIIATIAVTVSSAATTQDPVSISANAYASEEMMPVLVEATPISITKRIQARANVTIASIRDITGNPSYPSGSSFTIQLTFQNAGGTNAVNVDGIVDDGAYTCLNWSNPSPIAVAAGSNATQDFTFTVLDLAFTPTLVTIRSRWTGTEAITNRGLSGSFGSCPNVTLTIGEVPIPNSEGANVSIGQLEAKPFWSGMPASPFFSGTSFTINVTFVNMGALAATVDATLDVGTYAYFTWDDPAAVIVDPVSTRKQAFLVSIAAGAPTGNVTIAVAWNGTEAGTNLTLSGDSPVDTIVVAIQMCSHVSITGMTMTGPRAIPGPYIGGETITLRVTFTNTGGTAAMVDAVLDDGPYTGLTLTHSPPAVLVAAGGGTNFQTFNIPVLAGAATAVVNITAGWTGYELVSSLAISGWNSTLVNIQGQAIVTITSLVMTTPRAAPGPYCQAETLTLVVTFQNTGGTTATVDATLNDGAYTDLTFGNPAAVVVPVSSTITQTHTITVGAAAAVQAGIIITATWTGTETTSGRAISGDTPADTITLNIGWPPLITISQSIVGGRTTFVHGEYFDVRVIIDNSLGASAITGGTLTVITNPATGNTYNVTQYTSISIAAGNTATRSFRVMTSSTTQASFVLYQTFAATSPVMSISSLANITVNTTVPALVSITALAMVAPRAAPGPYYPGENYLVLRVTFNNAGGTSATVDATLDDDAYTGLTFTNNPAAVTVPTGGSATQDHTISVSTMAISQSGVIISATWSGTETTSGRAISGDTPADKISIDIIRCDPMPTVSQVIPSGRVTYVRGESFVVRVTIDNSASTLTYTPTSLTLDFGGAAGFSSNASVPLPNPIPGGAIVVRDFLVTTTAGAAAACNMRAHFVVSSPMLDVYTIAMVITTVAPAVVAITSLVMTTPRAAPGPYYQSESLTLVVTFTNTGVASASVDVTLDDGAYADLTFGNPSAVVVPAFGSNTQTHTISLSAVAAVQNGVIITATWTGMEQYSARFISGDTPPDTISIDITAGTPSPIVVQSIPMGRTTYVRGEVFVVRVTVDNTSGASAITGGTLSIDFGGAAGFSSNTTTVPSPIAIGTFVVRDFLVTTTSGAAAACNMRAHFVATSPERDEYAKTIVITTIAPAVVSITALVMVAPRAAPGPYAQGENTLVLRVTFINTGVITATVDATLDDGAYTGLTFTNNPAAVTVPTGGSATQDHTISVSTMAISKSGVIISAMWTGSEQYSGRALSGDTPPDTISIDIAGTPPYYYTCILQSIVGGRTTYVRGESYVVRVIIDNSAESAISGGTLAMVYIPNTGITTNVTYMGIAVGAGSVSLFDFLVTTSDTTAASYIQRISFTATTPVINKYSNTNITVTTVEPEAVSISGLAVTSPRPAPGPYSDEMLTLRVTFTNTGGASASVDATLGVAGYTHLSFDNPGNVTVPAGGSMSQDFTITIAGAITRSLTITATWTGTEQYSTRLISGDTPVDTISINIQGVANVVPVAIFTPNATTGRAGRAISFTSNAEDPDGTIVSWQWDFGDGTSATGATCVHVFSTAGTFTVVHQVIDDCGGIANASVTVTISLQQPGGNPPGIQVEMAIALVLGAALMTAGIVLAVNSLVKRWARRLPREF